MKIAIIALTVIFIGFGVVNNSRAISDSSKPPESWLEEKVPTSVGEYKLMPNKIGSKISYKMDAPTYNELKPIGIAAQRMTNGRNRFFDAVVIAGDRMESFHDQRWCFKAQGWDIKDGGEVAVKLKTKSYGEIPVTVVSISRPGVPETVALFTLRGPSGFHATIPDAAKDWFKHELFKQSRFNGFFFRFIPEWGGATREDVLNFAADYIDSAHLSSGGVI